MGFFHAMGNIFRTKTKDDYLKSIGFESNASDAIEKDWEQVGKYISDATEKVGEEIEKSSKKKNDKS